MAAPNARYAACDDGFECQPQIVECDVFLEHKSTTDFENDETVVNQIYNHKDISEEEGATGAEEEEDEDGGYGWVVVAAVFGVNITIGLNFAGFSLLYTEFIDYYGATRAAAGLVGSLNGATGNFIGFFLSSFIERYGCRPVGIAGSIIFTAGIALSAFAPAIQYLYFTFGLMTGAGCGLSFLTCAVIIQQHFRRKRTLATGLGMMGISVGALGAGFLINFLVDIYGLHGALLLMACFPAHNVAFCALMRPPEPKRMSRQSESLYQDHKKVAEPKPISNPAEINVMQDPESISPFVFQPPIEGETDDKTSCCDSCCAILDFSLLGNVPFLMTCIGTMLMNIGLITLYSHALSRALYYGVSRHHAAILPATLGVSTIAGTLVFGYIGTFPGINKVRMYGGSILAAGLIHTAFALAKTFSTVFVCTIAISFMTGCFFTVQSPVLVDLLGVRHIARAQSILNMFVGAGALIGVPLAGFLFDVSQNYDIPFYVTGILQMLGGVVCLFVDVIQRRYTNDPQDSKHMRQTSSSSS